jgi:hypothetical protein
VGLYDITVASVTFTQGNASNYTIIKNTATKGREEKMARETS